MKIVNKNGPKHPEHEHEQKREHKNASTYMYINLNHSKMDGSVQELPGDATISLLKSSPGNR